MMTSQREMLLLLFLLYRILEKEKEKKRQF